MAVGVPMKKGKQNNQMEFGNDLRRLRRRAALGLKAVAPQVNVSYTYLSKIENGHKTPSPELIERLCALYKADSDELISRLGFLPSDIQQIIELKGKEVFELLREHYPDRELKTDQR
jgi:transcriptional regulator with XRE-family HTH domain